MIPFAAKKKTLASESMQNLIDDVFAASTEDLSSKMFGKKNCEEANNEIVNLSTDTAESDEVNCEPLKSKDVVNKVSKKHSRQKHKHNLLKDLFALRKEKRNGKETTVGDNSKDAISKTSMIYASNESLTFGWQLCSRRDERRFAVHDIESITIEQCERHLVTAMLKENIRLAGLA